MEMEPEAAELVCRACLGAADGRLGARRALQLAACAGLRAPAPGDGLPAGLCARCRRRLALAAAFRRRARRADRQLRAPPPVKEEPDLSDHCVDEPALVKQESDDRLQDADPVESAPESTKKYQCEICNKPLSSKYSLKHHTINMHGEKKKKLGNVSGWGADRRFHCSECTYSTPHSQSLVYHIRIHTGEKPFECDKCDKRFSQPGSLSCHKKTHSDETYFGCELCGKRFKYKETYEAHKNVHAEIKKFICEICNKGLKSKKTLEGHMNRHYNIRNYSCETCGATFVTHVELLNHSKKHVGDKKFVCNLCNFRTYMKKGLETHLRRHMGDRPFKCDMCDLSCYTKGELKCHQRKHTKEKNYSCPVCEMKFIHSSSVNKHMLKVHGLKYNRLNIVDRRVVK